MFLPVLYKKTSTGAIQQWSIQVYKGSNEEERYGIIRTEHGQVGGKLQTAYDVIKQGKNTGKKNETNAVQQAELEAQSKWEKQKKKGYVESIELAEAGEVDALIEGGVAPMLAQKFSEHSAKIKWPAYISPKLDGIRCIAVIQNGKASLWTRTRKRINSMPHIIAALEAKFKGSTITLDGELYHPDYKDNFNKIISLVRPDEPVKGHEIVQYWVFDYVPSASSSFLEDQMDQKFIHRLYVLENFKLDPPLIMVPQELVGSVEDAVEQTSGFIKQGYEGGMVKNEGAPYEHKRSYHLQKIKTMQDQEFKVVGAEEGRGKLAGHVGSFICETPAGARFNVKLKGELDHLKHLFENPSEWQGKMLTVQFQNITPDGVPRFPVGVALRTYE